MFLEYVIGKNHISKSIADAVWRNFIRRIAYKANWYGRMYYKIHPWFAFSQICSYCVGKRIQKSNFFLSGTGRYEYCEAKHQRDENAAKNILERGLEELALIV